MNSTSDNKKRDVPNQTTSGGFPKCEPSVTRGTTISNVHLCSFSGGVARLTAKQRKDKVAILAALADDPRISTWDMDEGRPRLWKIIYAMVDEGLITELKEPYPWHRFRLTDAGKTMLEEARAEVRD